MAIKSPNVRDQFCKYAAGILNGAEWFTANPVTPDELNHFLSILMVDARNYLVLHPERIQVACSTRGITVVATISGGNYYYDYCVQLGHVTEPINPHLPESHEWQVTCHLEGFNPA